MISNPVRVRRSGAALAFFAVALACFLVVHRYPVSVRAADEQGNAAPNKTSVEESWQVVYVGKSRVGFGRTTTETRQRNGREVISSDTEMSMAITRFGQAVKTKTQMQTEETKAGDLLSFRFELLNPPAAPTRKNGRVENGKLIIDSEVAGKTTQSEMPWDGSLKAPGYQDRLLRADPLKPGDKRTIKSFDPQFGKVTVITITAGKEEEVALLGGQKKKLLKASIVSSVAPAIVIDEYLDASGEPLVTKMGLLAMAVYKATKDEALQSLSGEEADLAVATLVKIPRIDRARQTVRVTYRLTTPGDDPSRIVATGPTQQITSVGPDTIDLVVTAISPPEKAANDVKPIGAEFLTANDYLQSDNELVKKYADEAAGRETDPWIVSQKIERWVHQKLTQKNFSTLLASAAEVAKDLQGDCTEHAVLLSAMARARGVPSRVAVGLVYVDSLSSFGGHMWSEVWINGVWVPLDGTLGEGGIGAEHIKFADSSFSEKEAASPLSTFLPLVSVLGKLQIEVRKVEYR